MTVKQLLVLLGVAGPILAALAPWVGPFFDFKLISDYYQPALNSVASIFGVFACLATLAFTHKAPSAKKKSLAQWCLAGAVLSFILCLILKKTVGTLWAPGLVMTVVVSIAWILLYLLVFVLLFVALVEIGMLIPLKEPESNKSGAPKKPAKPKRTKHP